MVVVVVLGLNPLLKWIYPGYMLSRSELLTVVAMGLIGAHIPGSGLLGFFLGVLAAPYYFASPENQWEALLHPTIPSWLAPLNERGAMQGFFEGLPSGSVPWSVWIMPLFWWMCLIGVLTFVLLCMAVMLRKQWVENERLVYPLISPVSDLIEDDGAEGILSGLMRNKLFLIGFALGFGLLAWNFVWYFWDAWPRINYFGRKDLVFIDGFPAMTNRVNLYIIGFGYFANLDVLFSPLVFFYLILLGAERDFQPHWSGSGAGNRCGECMGKIWGALFALVWWALWTARHHLRDVVRKSDQYEVRGR